LFKLADDIKESVRVAAELALKSLQRVTISYSTAVSSIDTCQQTINSSLPILISQGLQNNLSEIRMITVYTIRDLTKYLSAPIIKDYLIDIIIRLLEALSEYEPPDLNYISLKLNSSEAQEKMDAARLSASKNTPMIEIIDTIIPYIDDDAKLSELIPRLMDILKKGLGVCTKGGACHILNFLIDNKPEGISPFSGKITASLVNCMSNEQNKTINKLYCNSLGSIVKVAKESTIENLLNKLHEWYFQKEANDGIRLSCGLTLFAIINNRPEVISKFSNKIIPFVFYAMHQRSQLSTGNQEIQTVWHEIWDEGTNGIKLLFNIIIKLLIIIIIIIIILLRY
jgi:proteasome component ECM29